MKLDYFFSLHIHWQRTTPESDYVVVLDGRHVCLRIKNRPSNQAYTLTSPSEQAYRLTCDTVIIGYFDDWPRTWSREPDIQPLHQTR
ncbi:hypothetical protein [Pseudomonas plecoglossicida]|uniref:hypothetical protein n=1 Tax=Pseudomonas plecoglossicida TaxID=70775 RepID=UPI003D1D7821